MDDIDQTFYKLKKPDFLTLLSLFKKEGKLLYQIDPTTFQPIPFVYWHELERYYWTKEDWESERFNFDYERDNNKI